MQRENFTRTKKRALFMPHCSRKYMDNRCQAKFDSNIPSYICAHCSANCLINQATSFAKKKGYDVYILPEGSCIPKILKSNDYEGIVGVACGKEIKLGGNTLENMGIAGQSVPLVKNGCANTSFNFETLQRIL
ncbi:MAG: DUF116 domain-containing protein [Candidatus Bathyarchaeota archaeon]